MSQYKKGIFQMIVIFILFFGSFATIAYFGERSKTNNNKSGVYIRPADDTINVTIDDFKN
ncbi:MAG: hypothetical protein ACXAAH_11495 [Promethearchaeota archaeon]|jgi:hypothetical protein